MMKNKTAYIIITVLAIAAVAFAVIFFVNNTDKAKQIDALNAELAVRDKQIEALNTDASDQTARIESLTRSNTEKDGKIEKLDAENRQMKETLDYARMPEEGLLGVVNEITPPLEALGYSVMVRNYTKAQLSNAETDEPDGRFLADMAKGLDDRWKESGKDTNVMTEAQHKEYITALAMDELNYIGRYAGMEFADKTLEELAHAYISNVQKQADAAKEYCGNDETLFQELWSDGYDGRAQMIYLINRKYGLDVTDRDELAEMVEYGVYADQIRTIDQSLSSQLANLELKLTNSSEYDVSTKPFTIRNETAYPIESVEIRIRLYNADNEQVGTNSLYQSNIGPGDEILFHSCFISTKFDHFDLEYQYYITGTLYDDKYYKGFSGQVVPKEQTGWNGMILKGGKAASGQAVLELEDLVTGWEPNGSRKNPLYVPTLTFFVKNVGDVESERVNVHIVFSDAEKNEVLDEQTVYVIGYKDGPLKPGYSKKAAVRSENGLAEGTTHYPTIIAEISINGIPVKTVEINKP